MRTSFLGLVLTGILAAGAASAEPRKSVITTTTTNTTNSNTTPESERPEVEAKNFNVRVNPLNLLFTVVNVDVDFKLHDKFTLGPTLAYSGLSAATASNASFFIGGVRGNFYLTGTAISSSFYVGPSAAVWLGSASSTVTNSSASLTALSFGGNVGYQWVASSGFNVTLGLGASYITLPSAVTTTNGQSISTSGLSGVLPSLEVDLGYAF